MLSAANLRFRRSLDPLLVAKKRYSFAINIGFSACLNSGIFLNVWQHFFVAVRRGFMKSLPQHKARKIVGRGQGELSFSFRRNETVMLWSVRSLLLPFAIMHTVKNCHKWKMLRDFQHSVKQACYYFFICCVIC